MKVTRRLGGFVVMMAVFVGAARPVSALAQAAGALDSVPANSLVLIKVKNLQETSKKIADFANKLGIAAMVPQMNDPLKAAEEKAHMTQGINAAGDMYVAYLDNTGTDEPGDKSMVVLIPVSDYKTFLGNFPDAQTDGDVSQVKMADDPEPGYVASWGSYAALSPIKDIVAKKPTEMLKLSEKGGKELMAKDIAVYANFTALRPILQPKLEENKGKLIEQMDKAMSKSPQAAKMEKMQPLMNAMANEFVTVASSFLRDAQAATYGVSLGDEGLSTTVMADFTPGSEMGNKVQSLKTSNATMLNGLPAGKYLAFGGYVSDPAATTKIVSDLIDPIVKEMVSGSPDAAPLNDWADTMKTIIGSMKGSSFGLFAPTGQLGQEAIIQQGGVLNGDADKILAAQQKFATQMPEFFKALGMPADTYKVTYTPKAKTVDGVTFDNIVTQVTPDPNSPQAAQQQQMMALMYGPNGISQFIGGSGDHVLFASGLSDAQISTLVDVAKTNDAPLSTLEVVKQVSGKLPTDRVAEMYVPLDTIVSTGLLYAKNFGFAMPVQLPPDLPPIGATISTDASAAKLDTYVPTALIQSWVAAGMQAAMQMGGNGGGGGGM